MNAEFLRNVWLELTPMRRWGLPLVVLMLLVLVNATPMPDQPAGPHWQAMEMTGLTLTLLFALWSAVQVTSSCVSEVIGGTWDQQRLAPYQPAQLLVGKLFGSTIFQWVGMAIGLMLFAWARHWGPSGAPVAPALATLLFGALLVQAVGLHASLLLAGALRATRRPGTSSRSNSGVILLVIVLLPSLAPVMAFLTPDAHGVQDPTIAWWLSMPMSLFVPFSLLLFLGWALLGAHRAIRAELQEPVSPWPWIAFQLFLAAYLYPFMPPEFARELGGGLGSAAFLLAVVFGSFADPLLLTERLSVVRLRSLVAARRRGDWHEVWTQVPLWPFSLGGSVIAVLALSLAHPGSDVAWGALGLLGALTIFMARDAGIVLTLTLSPRTGRRPEMALLFILALLYLLCPMLVLVLARESTLLLGALWPGAPLMGQAGNTIEPASAALMAISAALPGCLLSAVLAGSAMRQTLASLPASGVGSEV